MSFSAPSKTVKEEVVTEDDSHQLKDRKASVEITKCISFQKFRYSGEQRPGKKYQEKEFVTLKLSNLKDNVVRVIIMCVDANNAELIHPNGLIGANCKDGIYDRKYAVTKRVHQIEIPYVRIERVKIKKNPVERIKLIMDRRVATFPSPYKERCQSQCSRWEMSNSFTFNTAKVRLAVIVTLEYDTAHLNGTLHAASNVISNCSEKTQLKIHKLSNYFIPAGTGRRIDIFTAENGPDIQPEDYFLQVSYESEVNQINWKSEKYFLEKKDLLYKRVISYDVPPFEPAPDLVYAVTATLHLQCTDNNLHCTKNFDYIPQPDVQTIAEKSYNQGDINIHGMTQDTNSSSNEETTAHENGELLYKFQPINLENSDIIQSEGSIVQLENQGTSAASEDSTNISDSTFFIYSPNESEVKLVNSNDLIMSLGVSAQNSKNSMSIHPYSSGQDKQNTLILSEASCLTPVLDNNIHTQITQSVTVNQNPNSTNTNDVIITDPLHMQELPSSTDSTIPNADNRNTSKHVSLDINSLRSPQSCDQSATRMHCSEPISFIRIISKAQKIPTGKRVILNPWQVNESGDSEDDSSNVVKKQKLSQ